MNRKKIKIGKSSATNLIEKCRHTDSECFLRVAGEIVKRTPKGFPELGLPVAEPLRVEKLNIEQGGDGPVNLKIQLRNFDLKGLSKVQFVSFAGLEKIDDGKITVTLKFPHLELDGPYKIDGKVLILPVQGNGKASLKFRKFPSSFQMVLIFNKIFFLRGHQRGVEAENLEKL